MAGFGTEVDALLRATHITGAVVWLGLLYFMVLIRPKIMAGLSEEAVRAVAPRITAALIPWLAISSTLTILAGILLYTSMGLEIGFDNIAWTLSLGGLLAIIMYIGAIAFVVPVTKKIAGVLNGHPPPKPEEMKRMQSAARGIAYASFLVLFLMILAPRLGGVFV